MRRAIDSARSLQKTGRSRPEKRASGLSFMNAAWGPPTPRPVVGLRRVFRANETACSDGFLRERAESIDQFVTNPGWERGRELPGANRVERRLFE
jgi:hypothetical protein